MNRSRIILYSLLVLFPALSWLLWVVLTPQQTEIASPVAYILPNRLTPTPTQAPVPTHRPLSSLSLFALVNQYRGKQGLAALTIDEVLCSLSIARIPEVQEKWSHDGFFNRAPIFMQQHPEYTYIGENLATGFDTEQEILSAWDGSPSHKHNLLIPTYTHVCYSISGKTVVQILGVRSSHTLI